MADQASQHLNKAGCEARSPGLTKQVHLPRIVQLPIVPRVLTELSARVHLSWQHS